MITFWRLERHTWWLPLSAPCAIHVLGASSPKPQWASWPQGRIRTRKLVRQTTSSITAVNLGVTTGSSHHQHLHVLVTNLGLWPQLSSLKGLNSWQQYLLQVRVTALVHPQSLLDKEIPRRYRGVLSPEFHTHPSLFPLCSNSPPPSSPVSVRPAKMVNPLCLLVSQSQRASTKATAYSSMRALLYSLVRMNFPWGSKQ